jgi:hypothetical protein
MPLSSVQHGVEAAYVTRCSDVVSEQAACARRLSVRVSMRRARSIHLQCWPHAVLAHARASYAGGRQRLLPALPAVRHPTMKVQRLGGAAVPPDSSLRAHTRPGSCARVCRRSRKLHAPHACAVRRARAAATTPRAMYTRVARGKRTPRTMALCAHRRSCAQNQVRAQAVGLRVADVCRRRRVDRVGSVEARASLFSAAAPPRESRLDGLALACSLKNRKRLFVSTQQPPRLAVCGARAAV